MTGKLERLPRLKQVHHVVGQPTHSSARGGEGGGNNPDAGIAANGAPPEREWGSHARPEQDVGHHAVEDASRQEVLPAAREQRAREHAAARVVLADCVGARQFMKCVLTLPLSLRKTPAEVCEARREHARRELV